MFGNWDMMQIQIYLLIYGASICAGCENRLPNCKYSLFHFVCTVFLRLPFSSQMYISWDYWHVLIQNLHLACRHSLENGLQLLWCWELCSSSSGLRRRYGENAAFPSPKSVLQLFLSVILNAAFKDFEIGCRISVEQDHI